MALEDPSDSVAAALIESHNPTTGDILGSVPVTAPGEVGAIVSEVARVQPFWAALPISVRARYMRRTAQVLIDGLESLGELLAREQGRPRSEAYAMELLPSIEALHWISGHGEKILSDEGIRYTQPHLLTKRSFHAFEPLGVVGVFSSWNDPWSGPFLQAAVALMCGNGVVLKPSSLTPLIGRRIEAACERAGLPEGIVRVMHGGAEAGEALVDSAVAKVFFTGSIETGRAVAVRCAEHGKGAVLELGGKDAQIVLADADLDNAVSGCLWGGLANAGQTSSAIERVYVAREVAQPFRDAVVRGAGALRVGDPLAWDTAIGPMASGRQFEHVRSLVDEAVAEGATLLCGGPRELPGLAGNFYAPAVLSGVRPQMRLMREEILGPVIPIVEVDSEEEAVVLANDGEFGLGASVWTLDRDRGRRIARRLQAGSVWINEHMYSHGALQCSWGGVKRSGLGRSQSRFGFYECVNVKHIAWEPSRTRAPWWFPYDETLARALHSSAQLLYGRDEDRAAALRRGALPLARLVRRMLRS
ncbi:MAG: hypothetical protein NVSMB25_10190 [Thermoleophilaceae bacterium]